MTDRKNRSEADLMCGWLACQDGGCGGGCVGGGVGVALSRPGSAGLRWSVDWGGFTV